MVCNVLLFQIIKLASTVYKSKDNISRTPNFGLLLIIRIFSSRSYVNFTSLQSAAAARQWLITPFGWGKGISVFPNYLPLLANPGEYFSL